jgi:hypothetical protein
LELELLTVAMASGGRRRTEGCSVAQVGEEEVAGGFKMASSCFPRRWRSCCMGKHGQAAWHARWWQAEGVELWPPSNREMKHETCFHVSIETTAK